MDSMRTNSRLVRRKKKKKIVYLVKEITSGLRFQFLVVRDNGRTYPGFL